MYKNILLQKFDFIVTFSVILTYCNIAKKRKKKYFVLAQEIKTHYKVKPSS